MIAEVYISIDRVRDNAEQLQQEFNSEIARVVAHGALHLCGYKDKSAGQKKLMTAKENLYLRKYGLLS